VVHAPGLPRRLVAATVHRGPLVGQARRRPGRPSTGPTSPARTSATRSPPSAWPAEPPWRPSSRRPTTGSRPSPTPPSRERTDLPEQQLGEPGSAERLIAPTSDQ
jgi:hypothetical protein